MIVLNNLEDLIFVDGKLPVDEKLPVKIAKIMFLKSLYAYDILCLLQLRT